MSPRSTNFLIWAIGLEEDVAFNTMNFVIVPPYSSPPKHTMAPHLSLTKKHASGSITQMDCQIVKLWKNCPGIGAQLIRQSP